MLGLLGLAACRAPPGDALGDDATGGDAASGDVMARGDRGIGRDVPAPLGATPAEAGREYGDEFGEFGPG